MSLLVSSLAPSGCSSYSEVSSQHRGGLLHTGPAQDCRAMYPLTQQPGMTPGPPGSQGHGGTCMNQYMRPPMAPPPPPHSMMSNRGMMSNEGECLSASRALIGCSMYVLLTAVLSVPGGQQVVAAPRTAVRT